MTDLLAAWEATSGGRPTARFALTLDLDRSTTTLDLLDTIIELLRERGYPDYQPKRDRIVTLYRIEASDDPTEVHRRLGDLGMPSATWVMHRYAALALDVAELREDVEREVQSYGFLPSDYRWTTEVPA